MKIAKVIDGHLVAYPLTPGDVRAAHPNVSFPSTMPAQAIRAHGYEVVVPVAPPQHDEINENLVELDPGWVDGRWVQRWSVATASPGEVTQRTQAQHEHNDQESVRTNAALRALLTARPVDIDKYIDTNVTDLASAKAVLKILAKAVSLLGKETFQ